MDQPMIAAESVQKWFRTGKIEVHALRGVDVAVPAGEMVAIMGPSGCGKTTLLNCLSGLDDFDQGEVYIEGTRLRTMSDKKRTSYRAQRMGFIFQSYNLLPVISAVENVELPLLVAGTRPSVARKRPCSLKLIWPTAPTIARRSFPAGSASASRSPAPWSTTRPSSSPTSRPVRSTARPPTTCWRSCAASIRSVARPSSSSHMTRTSPPPATASST